MNPPDSHHCRAAQGWIELGNTREARLELDRIAPEMQSHPDVLEVRCTLGAVERRWEAVLAAAEVLLASAPDRCSGWVDRSYSLHELKRTQEAWDKLLPAVRLFPGVHIIPFNLACYACQLGRMKEAREWLAAAMKVSRRDIILAMALSDLDLEPLWPELARM